MRFRAHEIHEKTPLRWHGILRGGPAPLPWGHSLEITLRAVETANGNVPFTGGLRLGFTPTEDGDARQDLHVLATLRASTLLEKTGTAPLTLGLRVAGWRGTGFDRR